MMKLNYDKRKTIWSVKVETVARHRWTIRKKNLTARYGPKDQFCWRKHFQKNYRLIDIAKIIKYKFWICVKFNLPKVKYFCLMINFVFQRIRGYKICRIRTYGLGDMNFRSLSIFLKNNYGIYTVLTRVSRRSWGKRSPKLGKKVAGVEEEGPRCQVVAERRRGRQGESFG